MYEKEEYERRARKSYRSGTKIGINKFNDQRKLSQHILSIMNIGFSMILMSHYNLSKHNFV
jgi:hypothetical protein